MRKILFVCTGNMIRSVIAEYLLMKILVDKGINDIVAESAGTHAYNGNAPIENTVRLMKSHYIDVSAHRSRELTKSLIDEAELVVAMEVSHLTRAFELAPYAREKMALIGSFIPDSPIKEIADPIGGSKKDYIKAFDLIDKAVTALAEKLAAYPST